MKHIKKYKGWCRHYNKKLTFKEMVVHHCKKEVSCCPYFMKDIPIDKDGKA
jgi:hypothetical protein